MNNDDFTDPPPRKVQRYTDLREVDDFDNPPPLLDNPPPLLDYQSPVQVKRKRVLHKELSTKQKKGQSVALKKGIELSEIYGFEDVEPMFIDTDTPDFRGHNIDLTKEDDVMYRGRVFDKCYLVAQCVDKKCDWRVYTHQIGDSDEYEVRKVKLEHVCDVETRGQFTKHATSKVIAALVRSKYVNVTAGPRARDLPEAVLDEYNVTASYWKCWKAKELAISSAQGIKENSYLLLPLYLHLLQLANPGTVYHLETKDDELGDERFKFAFVSLGASIQGLKFIRRVVVVDGTHLQGKYNGCLLTASGQDANFQVFPIAFAIVDSENHDSWTWFMEKLKDIVGDGHDLTIISDRHQSIYHAKFLVYPQA
ncbi:MULE transposase domain [Arabidopsis suecica]|uniref:MULE transposase domain n=1 Tax=Arabidopsis suecica TaxID=45249 RepID=A0A8T2BQG4_ARASU|nr:MULE transposase domain [Arabidopsis suecica]